MSDSLRKFLINTGIGLVLALLVCCTQGLFSAGTAENVIRILCDGFFTAAALLLAAGGLQFTYNGGVMDGLSYTFKVGLARIKRDYETAKTSFAEYRENREAKASSPKYLLLAGLTHLVIALIFYAVYYSL